MPDAHPDAGPFQDQRSKLTKRVYKHDFVQFSPPGINDVLLGRIAKILRESESPRKRVFVVQHYRKGQLTREFTKVSGSNVTLHPVGRPGVLDE